MLLTTVISCFPFLYLLWSWLTDNERLMILIISGSNLSFQNPFTISPVFYIILMFVSVSSFCKKEKILAILDTSDCMTSVHLTLWSVWVSPENCSFLGMGHFRWISLSDFLHIALSPFHDKGYIPCCMCTNDKMWMCFHLFCFLPLGSLWSITQYIWSQCCEVYSSLLDLNSLGCVLRQSHMKSVLSTTFSFVSSFSFSSINDILCENVKTTGFRVASKWPKSQYWLYCIIAVLWHY